MMTTLTREQIEWFFDNCRTTPEMLAVKALALRGLDTVPRPIDGNTHATLRSANAARQKEWDTGNQITLAYRGNELAGEVGEACNIIKKLERERMGIKGSRATKEQLAEELADIVICTDLIAMDAGIDLEAAVAAKFNATSEKVGLATRMALPEPKP